MHVCGFKSNFLDQTAQHTGAFAGVSNTFATLSAAVSPLVGGRLLDGTRAGWSRMFLAIAAINLSAALFWATAASGESLDDKLNAAARFEVLSAAAAGHEEEAEGLVPTSSPNKDSKRKKAVKV